MLAPSSFRDASFQRQMGRQEHCLSQCMVEPIAVNISIRLHHGYSTFARRSATRSWHLIGLGTEWLSLFQLTNFRLIDRFPCSGRPFRRFGLPTVSNRQECL